MGDDIRRLNRAAWNAQVDANNRWTVPVQSFVIDAARRGEWEIVLTPLLPVPRSWFGRIENSDVLCLASGGGQQGPVLAAAGARVTVFDNSPRQLEQDRMVALRDGLEIECVEGDMADLGTFGDAAFDLIVHPVSNAFVPDLWPVWNECHRVLRSGGNLLAGFVNPVRYLFNDEIEETKEPLQVVNSIPYSDLESLSRQQKKRFASAGEPFEFGHSLDDQIGGQLAAGFVITGMYEDRNVPEEDPLSKFIASFMATRARKDR